MKFTITGSLGNISKPLVEELVQKGHSVKVISSQAEKAKAIEALGATAAIGSVEDVAFLTAAFTGADAVYCMFPPGNVMDPHLDIVGHVVKLANNYAQAIRQAGVKRVVHLSSIGAHTDQGNGILVFHYKAEQILKDIPGVAITHMRPVGFYYNLLGFIPVIKSQGIIASNYAGDVPKPWVSPIDIAAAVAQEIVTPLTGRKILYVASEEISCTDVASLLGQAIGKPDLKWVLISDDQLKGGLLAAGLNPAFASGLVEMNATIQTGKLYEDYYLHKPALGQVKVKDFAKDFAVVFNKK